MIKLALDGVEFSKLCANQLYDLDVVFFLKRELKGRFGVVKGIRVQMALTSDSSRISGRWLKMILFFLSKNSMQMARSRKILAGRLKGFMSSLISHSQSAFVHCRYILDSVVVINEAYDSVDWTFLDYMLSRFGFSTKWRNWINACLSSTSMFVLINGSPAEQFSISRGIGQGDHMVPFLFLMVAEGFAGLVRRARSTGVFDGLKIGRGDIEVCDL
ncbi:PREDICTED: uncharacterized protein LOC109353900 [Lupinus angustifolius]|uniref:uncharacterized protein LOC109353900 n=1 Tax=Lupinus angustifolius TaxID=3871 RepID=UPI00092EB4DE|nr:PREDICTED: uncharacterized protein LOC109353900 [Lupinus angustifolius]